MYEKNQPLVFDVNYKEIFLLAGIFCLPILLVVMYFIELSDTLIKH